MDKALNEIAGDLFARALSADPAWVRSRGKEPLLGGAPVFEKRVDRDHALWLSFGGFKGKESLFGLFGGWTCAGLRYNQLEVVEEHPGADNWPASGLIDLRDVAVLTGQAGDRFVSIDLPPPPEALRQAALDAYVASPAYALWLDKAVAFEARRKQPPTREQIDAETRRAEAVFMAQWSHLLERLPEALASAPAAVGTAVDAAMALLGRRGLPFLQARIGTAG